MFDQVERRPDFPQQEEELTAWWKKQKTFERSVSEKPEDDTYSFLDGPPFVTGKPHYAHLLSRIAKDVIPRYHTMKGKRVRRVWGWDCHGLPIEEKVEKKLKLANRRAVEAYGIHEFIDACHTYVDDVSSEWEWYVDRIGHWINFKNAYKTMDLDYMESVIWAFKQLYDKDLVYEGVKTLLYCTRCGTPVSKFEISMDDSYADKEDPALTVEFPVTTDGDFKDARILAWTTTPWTLPANRALVVDPQEDYVQFSSKEAGKTYIAAKKRMESLMGEDEYKTVREFKGKELVGLSYQAPYEYFEPNDKDWQVYSYEGMVHMQEGTGIVHSAPGFGEIDTEMGEHYGLTMMFTVDDEGNFVSKVTDFAGQYVKEADPHITQDLAERDLLFKSERITHRYPFCYRCETPLIQRSQKAWFLKVQELKENLLKQNEKINWVPDKLTARFVNTVETAPDWCISRTRYWATAMPIWRCEECQQLEVFGSIKEIEERSGQEVTDLHRNGVDHIEFDCQECKGKMKRIPEVFDCWLESGSMPYGQLHYPFENEELFDRTFPADYIVEYVAQIRAWFYYMHLMSNALLEQNSFRNVVTTGVMWGTDGRKMSKSFGNYPDPRDTLNKYGGDAIRLYLMGSSLMLGEDANFNEKELSDQVRNFMLPLWNSYLFFVTYANQHNWQPKEDQIDSWAKSDNQLDQWIQNKLEQIIASVTEELEAYNLPKATQALSSCLPELSKWYIRRSRSRFADGDQQALATLYTTLVKFTKLAAPFTPFISETLYQNLVHKQFGDQPESIHLCDYPSPQRKLDQELLTRMDLVRSITELGQTLRANLGIRVRQPLSKIIVATKEPVTEWMEDITLDELNIKQLVTVDSAEAIEFNETETSSDGLVAALDTHITADLKQEGLFRELVRSINVARKKAGLKVEDQISLQVSGASQPEQSMLETYQDQLATTVKAANLETTTEQLAIKVKGTGLSFEIHKQG